MAMAVVDGVEVDAEWLVYELDRQLRIHGANRALAGMCAAVNDIRRAEHETDAEEAAVEHRKIAAILRALAETASS